MEQFCGCWMTYPRCKEDCYWYEEWQDMGAHIPYCRCKRADFIEPKDCENCEQYHSKYKPINADKIREMSNEKLARWIAWYVLNITDGRQLNDATAAWLEWLKQEVNDVDFD